MWRRIGLLGSILLLSACWNRDDTTPKPVTITLEQPNSFLQFVNTQGGRIEGSAYATAYYQAVDPNGERTTLDAWKQKNGFGSGGDVTHIIFRDAMDLGYGRSMYARKDAGTGNIAIFVENFVVALEAAGSTNYGPLNVEAAIYDDRRYLFGTNAIEFSPIDPADPASQKIVKFFTFAPDATGVQRRVLAADFDGRGVKSVPTMCMACHGGQPLPLAADGSFPVQTLRSGKMNLLDAAILEYSSQAGWQRAQEEAGIKTVNGYVHDSFTAMQARPGTEAGRWSADFAIALAEGRYGGSGLPASTHQDSFIPPGWQQNANRPAGVEQLFKQVVEPHCVGCHALQGTTAGEAVTTVVDGQTVSLANAINFSSYEKFISYRSHIIDYVYRRGIMPLSLRNFERFWREPQGAPALLAAYLNDSSLFDGNGNVVAPGRPVAKPGAARTVRSPVQLDGSASLFARSHRWQILSTPTGATASLSSATSARPILTADTNGSYSVQLVVSNTFGDSAPATQTVTFDSTLTPAQSQLTFVNDVLPLFTGLGCTACHVSGTDNPVSWQTDSALYSRVLARVNARDPENSRLLFKPTGLHHGGGMLIDTTTTAGQVSFNTLLNWIREGAVCGNDGALCP